MQRFLDLTNDLAFKKVFSHKTTLIGFLNAILDLKNDFTIVSLEYISQEEVPISLEEKKRSIMDVRCLTKNGIYFIVEMQNVASHGFLKRAQFYAASTYVSQLAKGAEHKDLKSVVLIAVVGEIIFEDDQACVSTHKTVNVKTGVSHLADLSYVFVELPKFKKTKEECVDLQDQWIYTFQNADGESDIPFSDKALHEVYEYLEKSRWTSDEYQDYIWIKLRDAEIAQKQIDEFTAGKAEGKAEGKVEGKAEGRIEEKYDIARAMKTEGIAIGVIAKTTGLTEKEIVELADA